VQTASLALRVHRGGIPGAPVATGDFRIIAIGPRFDSLEREMYPATPAQANPNPEIRRVFNADRGCSGTTEAAASGRPRSEERVKRVGSSDLRPMARPHIQKLVY